MIKTWMDFINALRSIVEVKIWKRRFQMRCLFIKGQKESPGKWLNTISFYMNLTSYELVSLIRL